MVRAGTDEMGVLSVGCNTTTNSSPGTLYETSCQVAQTWASLPPPDNYTPSKAQTAYRTIFDGLLNIAAGTAVKRLAIAAAAVCIGIPINANAGSFTTLYTFEGGSDGNYPMSRLIYEGGALYGTMPTGGIGKGSVFKIEAATGAFKNLYAFKAGSDGSYPLNGVTYYDGMLYGGTGGGGGSGCVINGQPNGCGTIFSINPKTHVETILYEFSQDPNANPPGPGDLFYQSGTLYATTSNGGSNGDGSFFAFNVSTSSFNTLYSFGGAGGIKPGPQLLYENGLLYGTTRFGGSGCLRDGGCGTVFSLDPTTGAEAVLYRFKGYYGEFPNSNLSYHAGSLIGDTSAGGNRACERGCGINFKIKATTGRETVLEDFGSGGENYSGITVVNGNAYETLPSGGSGGYGELLEVNLKSGQKTVLYTFTGGSDGNSPQAPLTYHNGAFYGTTFFGGNDNCYEGCGTVFKFVP